MHNYHNSFGRFPGNTEGPTFSPFMALLPYLEQDAIAGRYDKSKRAR